MILTEKEKKLIDKFYLKMGLGTDSKLLIIEKITEDAIYYSFLGYNYIFDSETETEQQILTDKELTEKIIEIIPFWEQDENSKKDTFKMLQSNDIKQIKHIIDFLQDYNEPKIIAQLNYKIYKIKELKK